MPIDLLRDPLNRCHDHSIVTDEPPNWPSYIVGVIAYLLNTRGIAPIPSGLNVVVASDVPCNKGLASSAALEVSVARAGILRKYGVCQIVMFL